MKEELRIPIGGIGLSIESREGEALPGSHDSRRMKKEAKVSEAKKVYQKDGNMVARKIAGELILVPIRQEAGDLAYFYSLNPVGARVWELLDGQRSAADIAGTIVEEYEVDLERAAKDALRFLRRLEELEMVTCVNGRG